MQVRGRTVKYKRLDKMIYKTNNKIKFRMISFRIKINIKLTSKARINSIQTMINQTMIAHPAKEAVPRISLRTSTTLLPTGLDKRGRKGCNCKNSNYNRSRKESKRKPTESKMRFSKIQFSQYKPLISISKDN